MAALINREALVVSGLAPGGPVRLLERTVGSIADFAAFMAERPQAFVAEFQVGGALPDRARRDFVKLFVQSAAVKNLVRPFHVPEAGRAERLYSLVLTEAANAAEAVWVDEALMDGGLNQQVDRLLTSMLTTSPAPSVQETQQQAGAALRDDLLRNEAWLDSAEVHALLGLSEATTNPGQAAARLRRERKIFGVKHAGKCLHPRAQFDEASGTVLPVVPKLLALLPKEDNGWRNLFWLFEQRRSLGGKRPADLLATQPEAVLNAARDTVEASDAHW